MAVLTASLGCEAFAADESTFFTDERLQLTPVTGVESIVATLVAAFELSLALTVGLKLRGCVG